MGIFWPRTSKGSATALSSRSASASAACGCSPVAQDERELVAADAGDEGAVGRDLEPPRDGAQQLIADHVAEDVVGLLELIEIDGQDGEALAACLGALESLAPAGRERVRFGRSVSAS